MRWQATDAKGDTAASFGLTDQVDSRVGAVGKNGANQGQGFAPGSAMGDHYRCSRLGHNPQIKQDDHRRVFTD